MNSIEKSITDIFLVDIRSLSLCRILFATLLIIDLLIRSISLRAHYTNEGILPLEALFQNHWKSSYLSVHVLNGDFYYQLILFVIAIIFAFFLLIGFFTRTSTIISWFLLISMQTRNPLILQGGDVLFRCLMFWA